MSLNKPWLALEGFCPDCEQPLGINGICTTCKHTVTVETFGDRIWVTKAWGSAPESHMASWSGPKAALAAVGVDVQEGQGT